MRSLTKVDADEVSRCRCAFAVLVKGDGLCSEAVMGSDRSKATECHLLSTNNRSRCTRHIPVLDSRAYRLYSLEVRVERIVRNHIWREHVVQELEIFEIQSLTVSR
jgi:hypothetical protein